MENSHDLYPVRPENSMQKNHLAVSFWELDVKEMFPSLNWTLVYEAVFFFRDHIWDTLVRRQNARGDCMVFYINRFDKHLDRMGGRGDSKLFHRISFADVKQFILIHLEANDVFLLGSTLMRHLWGVAIGGTCSAPCLCILARTFVLPNSPPLCPSSHTLPCILSTPLHSLPDLEITLKV